MMTVHTIDLNFLGIEQSIAAFLVEGPTGIALIECGPHSTLPHLIYNIGVLGFDPKAIQHVFISHIHFDHAGAAWHFAEQGATIYVHPLGLPHLAAPEKLYNSARQIYGERMDELWGRMEPIEPAQLYAPEHGEVITACGLSFTAWHSPGHAVHHISYEVGED
jgi:glyoxylase-like metal-dependent hydrolase (beta-lactamase superfamily II)